MKRHKTISEQVFTTDLYKSFFPLTKVFELNGNMYIYDAKSHFLTEINEEQLAYILDRNLSKHNSMPIYISKLLDIGFFSQIGLSKITPPQEEINNIVCYEIENYFPRKFFLDITEECTLRCKYCFYTNEDEEKRRHTQNHMDEYTAYKAIDYYYARYACAVNKLPRNIFKNEQRMLPPNLSWWGGEPLLQFDLIKKTKSYFESLDWESLGISLLDVQYSIVSNFTIISDEIIDFIVDNAIYLTVSMDGDMPEHDKNRVFQDGSGSFDTVFRNLCYLIEKYPDYANKYVTLQSVLTDNIDGNKVVDFMNTTFNIDDRVKRKVANWSYGRQRITGEFIPGILLDVDSNCILNNFTNTMLCLRDKCEADLEVYISSNRELHYELLSLFVLEESINFDFPEIRDINSTFSCPIGSDTMFISRNGDIHCCCKTDQSFPLGNVNTGLDPGKIVQLYEKYFNKIEQQCTSCWAIRFCKICPAFTCYNGKIKLPETHECEYIRTLAVLSMCKYLILNIEFDELYEKVFIYFRKRKKEFRIDSQPFNIKIISHEKN